MKKMFITRPNFDIGTSYLFYWSQEIIDFALKKNWVVEKSDGKNANKKEFESRIKNKPGFVFINGHGEEKAFCGHENKTLVGLENSIVLKDVIVFVRACSSLEELGKKAVSEGCRAFIGYKKEFWIPRHHSFESVPLKDSLAKPVLEVSNAIPISIIKGQTVREAVRASNNLAEKYFLKLFTSSDPYDRATLKAIINNMSVLGVEGDENTKIE